MKLHNIVDELIVAFIISTAITEFYDDTFKLILNPIISSLIPEIHHNKKIKVFGAKIDIHQFLVSFIKLLLSFLIAFLIHKRFKK